MTEYQQLNKETFLALLGSCQRDTSRIIAWLERSDFFEAPASYRHHLSIPGGLCAHSLNVQAELLGLNSNLSIGLDNDSVIICGLLHDICKANTFKAVKRNRKNDAGKWEEYDAYEIDDKFPVGHGEKSVIILQKYIDLTAEEVLAIRWHMGAYDASGIPLLQMSSAARISKLVLALQMADQVATFWKEA